MKLILAMMMILSVGAQDVRNPQDLSDKYEGRFSEPTTIAFMGYMDEVSCVADGGDYDEGLCLFDTENSVHVFKLGRDDYSLSVDTIGTNGHSCMFSGDATVVADNHLQSREPSETYDYETDSWVKVMCIVDVMYSGDSVSVSTNGNCREFCGMNGFFSIENAQRKN